MCGSDSVVGQTPSSRQGAGNSIFTLMKYNENPELTVYATDYSYQAVEVVKVSLLPYSSRQEAGLTTVERDVPGPGAWQGHDQRPSLGHHFKAAFSPFLAGWSR